VDYKGLKRFLRTCSMADVDNSREFWAECTAMVLAVDETFLKQHATLARALLALGPLTPQLPPVAPRVSEERAAALVLPNAMHLQPGSAPSLLGAMALADACQQHTISADGQERREQGGRARGPADGAFAIDLSSLSLGASSTHATCMFGSTAARSLPFRTSTSSCRTSVSSSVSVASTTTGHGHFGTGGAGIGDAIAPSNKLTFGNGDAILGPLAHSSMRGAPASGHLGDMSAQLALGSARAYTRVLPSGPSSYHPPPGSCTAGRSELAQSAHLLLSYCLLQYTSVLKIVKKHDKLLEERDKLQEEGDRAERNRARAASTRAGRVGGGVGRVDGGASRVGGAGHRLPAIGCTQPHVLGMLGGLSAEGGAARPASEPPLPAESVPLRSEAVRLLEGRAFCQALRRSKLFAALARCGSDDLLSLSLDFSLGALEGLQQPQPQEAQPQIQPEEARYLQPLLQPQPVLQPQREARSHAEKARARGEGDVGARLDKAPVSAEPEAPAPAEIELFGPVDRQLESSVSAELEILLAGMAAMRLPPQMHALALTP
jgi:hypothetical protein